MQSQILLPNMSGKIDYIGAPVKSIGYYSYKTNKRSQTLAIHTTNFVGRFILEGSLKLNPASDNDWFPIILKDNLPYIEYNDLDIMNARVIRKNDVYTIKGSYLWLRGRLDRDYLDIIKTPVAPYDLHSSKYIMTSNVDINNDYSHTPYPKSSLNPKYDPEYYEQWKPNYASASSRSLTSSQLGNIDKVLLCY